MFPTTTHGHFRDLKKLPTKERWLELLHRLAPFTRWMRKYDVKRQLKSDIVAGLAVSFLIVPQGLSYAQVAGLPAQFGLCA